MSSNWNPTDAPTWCRLSGDLPQMNGNVVVMVDESPDRLSSFFEIEIPSLPENLQVRLLKMPGEADEDGRGILTVLQETLSSLIPEIGPEFTTLAPGKWIESIKAQRANGTTNDRWIMVDRFHLILNAPVLERKIFAEILQQLAVIPSFGVIVGITTESAVQMAALLNLIENKDESDETRPLPAILDDTENSSRNAKVAAGVWASVTAVVLALGLGIAGYFGVAEIYGKKEPATVVFGTKNAAEGSTVAETGRSTNAPLDSVTVEQIEPAGHSTDVPQFALPNPTIATKLLDMAHIGGQPKFVPGTDSPRHEVLYFVAEANCFGHGVEKNLEKGIAMLEESNQLGSEKAANLLGTCYSRGFGVSQDYKKAKVLFQTAIERGSKHAYGNIGVLYLRGLGVTKNSVTAREKFVRGGKAGDPVAAFFAAKCFENGIGAENGKPNQDLAVFWYLEAARDGHVDALDWCRERELLPAAPKTITF